MPDATTLPGDTSGVAVPYVFVADEAFPLKPYLMRPFPGRQLDDDSKRIYNYRLSRARRVVENAFGKCILSDYPMIYVVNMSCFIDTGILAHRWRLLLWTIVAELPRAVKLVKAMCVLHNFLRTQQDQHYSPPGLADAVEVDGQVREGMWRSSQLSVLGEHGHSCRSSTQEGSNIRQQLVAYFSNEGTVAWQLEHIHAR